MSPPASIATSIPTVPDAPPTLCRLLAGAEELRTGRSITVALSGDTDVSGVFQRLARRALPGRRFLDVNEAVELLGESVALRLATLAAGTRWLRSILGDDPVAAPLLRHCIAAGVAAEPLGRDSGVVDPNHAFVLGLLHHLGDAVRLASRRKGQEGSGELDVWEVGAELIRSAGAPDALGAALVDYGQFMRVPTHEIGLEAKMLAAADHAVTVFGYSTPSPCSQPAVNAPILDTVASLFESKRRITRSIESLIGPVLDQCTETIEPPSGAEPSADRVSMVVQEEVLEGVSARDLGPLPVLFSRIANATDADSIAVAGTAGLVEELGVLRAWFLANQEDGSLNGGVLCARGNVPLPLHGLTLRREDLPRPLEVAVQTGRPILHEGLTGGLEALATDEVLPIFFVPVMAGKELLGVLGVEIRDKNVISPDLLTAIAVHTGLALKAHDLKKQSDEARMDELTGLYNRRGILDILDHWMTEEPADRSLAIALMDCDHLKKVNDNFGHLMGDEFVRRISEVLHRSLRTSDELGRYGGDEFLAILPDVGLQHTRLAMERSRSNVERAGLDSEDGLLLSVSIGAVVRGKSGASKEKLLKLADYALYRAKGLGRNAVDVIHAEQPPDLSL